MKLKILIISLFINLIGLSLIGQSNISDVIKQYSLEENIEIDFLKSVQCSSNETDTLVTDNRIYIRLELDSEGKATYAECLNSNLVPDKIDVKKLLKSIYHNNQNDIIEEGNCLIIILNIN